MGTVLETQPPAVGITGRGRKEFLREELRKEWRRRVP